MTDETRPEPAAPFTSEWRLTHAAAGDRALELAAIGALSDLAAAHYAAANVRARPALTGTEREGIQLAAKWLGQPDPFAGT
jgi:hypothetical protein